VFLECTRGVESFVCFLVLKTMTSTIFPKVFGVPLSQPFRSVVWLLLQKHIPFQIQLTLPGASTRIGTLHESYKAKTGVTTVPVLQVTEEMYIPESPAILKYLCETYGWTTDWYPSSSLSLSPHYAPMVDVYMHWHHSHTRHLSKFIRPYLRPGSAVPTEQERIHCHKTLQSLNDFWLSSSSSDKKENVWIASRWDNTSRSSFTIADLLAYEEVVQLPMTGIMTDLEHQYPTVGAWMARMRTLDHHDAVHAAVLALGTLPAQDLTQHENLTKLLGNAAKTGLKAIHAAQDTYIGSNSGKL
jgi:glutathione S-transferase